MLDLGANVPCDARNLVEFAMMGEAFAPRGARPDRADVRPAECRLRGDERRRPVRATADILRASYIGAGFHGFIEGNDITAGTTDIVVTDGFTGNVALKTGEGALKLIRDLLRQVFTRSIPAQDRLPAPSGPAWTDCASGSTPAGIMARSWSD